MIRTRLLTALCLLLPCLSPVLSRAQQKTLIADTLFEADGSRASGTATISWPAFTSPDNFPIAQGTITINIANGSISVQLVPTIGASPAGTSYMVSYFLTNSVSYTEYWTVPVAGTVTLTQVRTTPVPVPTTTFGEHQLTLGNGLQTPLGIWRQSTAPVATAEGQCYWDLTAHAIKCTDQTLSFNALGGSDPTRVSKAGDTLTGSLLAANSTVQLGTSSQPFGAFFQSAASGLFGNVSTFSVTSAGQSMTVNEPLVGGDPNERIGVNWAFNTDGLSGNPNFSNQSGLFLSLFSSNGQNDTDQSGKKTFVGINNRGTHYGSGQRFAYSSAVNCYGMGDCFSTSEQLVMFGGMNAAGDEGAGFRTMNLVQGTTLSLATITVNTPQTTCNTSITQNVTKNLAAQQVTVASTTGCNVSGWVVIDRGVADFSDGKMEAVKITAVSSGVITAVFVKSHVNGAPVTPATRVAVNSVGTIGHLRYLVNLSQPAYSTGTISGVNVLTLTGSGTSWTSNMVGGDSTLSGCLSMAADDYSSFPYSPSSVLRSWYPITSVSSGTTMAITTRNAVGQVSYTGNGPGGGGYAVRPCARVLNFESSPTNPGNVLILETNTFPWSVGDSVEGAMAVSGVATGEIMRVGWWTPGATLPAVYNAVNEGGQTFGAAFLGQAQMSGPNQTAYKVGLFLQAQMGTGISLVGTTTNGIGLDMTQSAAGDNKAVHWSGNSHDAAIYADSSTGDLVLTRSYTSPTTAPRFTMSGSTQTSTLLGNLVVSSGLNNKIRLENKAAGASSYELRNLTVSALDPLSAGLDFYFDGLNRPLMGTTLTGIFGMNDTGPATLSANTNSYYMAYLFETFNGVSSDPRWVYTRVVPDPGIQATGGTAPVEWQLLGTGGLNAPLGFRPVFAGFKNTGIFRFGNPSKGLVSFDASGLTTARVLTLPDAAGMAALTTAPGTSGTTPNWTSTGGLNIPRASTGGVTAGLLSNTDYGTFSAKENALTFSSPLSRSTNTISCPNCEVVGNKNVASGYAGLTSSGKLVTSQGQKVWAVTDLTTYTSTSGSGGTALQTTISSPTTGQVLTYNGSDWVNQTSLSGSHNLLSITHPDTAPASVIRGDLVTGQGGTPTWSRLALGASGRYLRSNGTDLTYSSVAAGGAGSCGTNQWITSANDNAAPTCVQPSFSNLSGTATAGMLPSTIVYSNQANTYSSGLQDFGSVSMVFPKSADPGSPSTGQVWVNSGALKYRDNAGSPATQVVEVQSNKNVANGYAGLTGSAVLGAAQFPVLSGDVTTTGGSLTVSLPNIVTAATNTKITYNAKGQVTAGTTAAASDLSNGTTGSGQIVLATSPTITTPAISGALTSNLDLGANAEVTEIANDTTTGTTANLLAKLTGATSAAIKAATADTSGVVGVVTAGAGTSGNAQIARNGIAACAFDGSTIAGDYVQISSSVAGDCRDAGSTPPTTGQVIGRVLTTNGSAGTYTVLLSLSSSTGGGGGGGGGGVTSLNGNSVAAETMDSVNDTNVQLAISQNTSSNNRFTMSWSGTLAKSRTLSTTVYTDQNNTHGAFVNTFQAGSNFFLTDTSDTTKKLKFDASNITTATTRTINVPDANSTTVQAISSVTHKFLTALSGTTGAFTQTQPACGDLSDSSGGCSMSTTAGGDLSGTLPSPTVTATHLSSALPVNQGGTGQTSAGSSGQVLVGNGSTFAPADFPEVKFIPAANCSNGTASNGWSLGSGGTVACRAGTNNLGGYVQITTSSSTFAQFLIEIPADWNSASNPYIAFLVASTDTSSGHTIIPAIQTSCFKANGTTTDDVTLNAAHSLSTITLNTTANQTWTSNVQMNSTDVTGCAAGGYMIVSVQRATDTATNARFYGATITFPRRLTFQAN